jgi:hypothetical protein
VRLMAHMRFCRRYRCCSSLRQGRSVHSSLGLVSGALVCSMLCTPLHSTHSDLRQHILGITPGIRFSDHPTRQMHAVGTCSCDRPYMRVICWLLRSDSPFCVAFRSPAVRRVSWGVNTDHGGICRSLSVSILDQAPLWLVATCVNSVWLVNTDDGSCTDSLALAIATC